MLSYDKAQDSFYLNGKYLLKKDAVSYYRGLKDCSPVARVAIDQIVNEILYDGAMWSRPFKDVESILEPHQRKGVYHLLTRKRSYLAHAPGAGKTLQAIAAHWIRRKTTSMDRPTSIIVCPPSLVANWRREILKWTPKIRAATGMAQTSVNISPVGVNPNTMGVFFDSRADFIICPDSVLFRACKQLSQVKSNITVVDESSRFKTPTSQRSQALYGSSLIQAAKHFVMLDGSPITLGAVDLWAPMYYLDPEAIDFRTFQEYCEHFTVTEDTRFGIKYSGSKNLTELRKRFFARFGHGVAEKDLYHPVRLREIVEIGSTNFDTERFGEEGLSQLGRMPTLDETGNDSLAEYRRRVGSEKVEPGLKYIQGQINDGKRVLVFAYHREVCEKLAGALNTMPLYGGVPANVREYELEQFKRGKTKALVGGIGPMGRGHNIQEADLAVFVEWSWSDEENKQGEKRISRMGNDSLVVPCVYLALKDSVDERILTAVLRKQGDFDAVFG